MINLVQHFLNMHTI